MNIVVSQPQIIKYRSFTLNIESYIDAAEKEVQLLTRNPNAKHYWLAGTLSFESPLFYKQHKKQWDKVARRIRDKGVILYWVREITTKWIPSGEVQAEETEFIHRSEERRVGKECRS